MHVNLFDAHLLTVFEVPRPEPFRRGTRPDPPDVSCTTCRRPARADRGRPRAAGSATARVLVQAHAEEAFCTPDAGGGSPKSADVPGPESELERLRVLVSGVMAESRQDCVLIA
jgi:hypothetical protein